MSDYQYKTCGLDNVTVTGLPPITDDDGNTVHTIPNINLLHKAIARIIISQPFGMSGKELRFLRTEMGLTQSELADIVHREPLAISRWERNETEFDSNAEVIIRALSCAELGLGACPDIRQLTRQVTPSAVNHPIIIDGSDPKDYRPLAA